MVKRVLYMLVLAVTLQLSWAVAAAYCMHESGSASQHFGHHQHEHASNDGADHDKSPAQKKAIYDPDCASCSHSPAGATALAGQGAGPVMAAHAAAEAPKSPPDPYLGLPERPQWTVAA